MLTQILTGVAGLALFIGGLILLTRYLEAKRQKDEQP